MSPATPAAMAARARPVPARTCFGCQRLRPASMFGPTAVPGGKHFLDRCSNCRDRMSAAQRDRARASGRCEWYRCTSVQTAHFRCRKHLFAEDREAADHADGRAARRVKASPIRFRPVE